MPAGHSFPDLTFHQVLGVDTHDERFSAASDLHRQHAAIRFHARPVGDARQPASAPQGTYLAGETDNVTGEEPW